MGLLKTKRCAPPAHYSLKIENFSSVVKEKVEKYESNLFEAGGYNWRLCVYPNGNAKDGGANHISLYLSIDDNSGTKLSVGWEVKIDYKMLVFDHKADNYLCIQDDDGKPWRFHEDNKEWGFGQLIDLPTFQRKYLFNDSCVFGVEIFVVKPTGHGECLSIINDPSNATLKFEIPNFSDRIKDDKIYSSEEFTCGGRKWKWTVYPNGSGKAKGNNLSMFLTLVDRSTLPSGSKVYATYKLRLINIFDHKNDVQRGGLGHWFSDSKDSRGVSNYSWGWPEFLPLKEVNKLSKGFLVKDSITVEGQITAISKVKYQP